MDRLDGGMVGGSFGGDMFDDPSGRSNLIFLCRAASVADTSFLFLELEDVTVRFGGGESRLSVVLLSSWSSSESVNRV